jgi:arginyl-tRNA synthetase
MIKDIVMELKNENIVVESAGAQCIFCTEIDEVPLMVVKSDGGYGYDSTDLAAIKHRIFEEKADWLIYVTDLGQETHFLKIFAAARKAGWKREEGGVRMDHVGFGVVQGEDGKRFKTRSGDVVRLADLLDEAEERALKELEGRDELEGE